MGHEMIPGPGLVALHLLGGWDTHHSSLELSAARPSSPAPLSPTHNSITPLSTHRLAGLRRESWPANCMRGTRLGDWKDPPPRKTRARRLPHNCRSGAARWQTVENCGCAQTVWGRELVYSKMKTGIWIVDGLKNEHTHLHALRKCIKPNYKPCWSIIIHYIW